MTETQYDLRNPAHLVQDKGALKSKLSEKIINKQCPHCHGTSKIMVNSIDYDNWRTGGLYIQDAFPWASVDTREVLQTGIHPACWDEMFPDE